MEASALADSSGHHSKASIKKDSVQEMMIKSKTDTLPQSKFAPVAQATNENTADEKQVLSPTSPKSLVIDYAPSLKQPQKQLLWNAKILT